MSVTIDRVNARRERELKWGEFLTELRLNEPQLYAKLMEDELEHHDSYVDGELRLIDIRVVVAAELALD